MVENLSFFRSLSSDDLAGEKIIELRFVKFQNVQNIVVSFSINIFMFSFMFQFISGKRVCQLEGILRNG